MVSKDVGENMANFTDKDMHKTQEKQIQLVLNYTMPQSVREVAISKFNVSDKNIDLLWREWLKFIVLYIKYGEITMSSESIDAIWHSILLDTREYEKFQREIGKTIHHIPNVPSYKNKLQDTNNFFECYTQEFGEVHSVWSTDPTSNKHTTNVERESFGQEASCCAYDD